VIVAVVLGTRPEAIKLAPVIRELERRDGVDTVVVSSGQHREMLDQMLGVFRIVPDVDLGLMRDSQPLDELTADLVRGFSARFRDLRPDWVVVQGDTTTSFCAALAAFYEGIRVAHVEAGLRSGSIDAPFPEEANRRFVSVLARLHLCPTEQNAAGLIAEGAVPDDVLVTGNTVIDALLWAVEEARRLPPPIPRTRRRRIVVTLHRREIQGETMRRVCETIRETARRKDTEIVFPVHLSPAVREVVVPTLGGVEGVHLCEPLDYLSFVAVLDSCDLVLTDSGGVQEEAPALAKPVLVLRDTTERWEAVQAGVVRLTGTDPARVCRHVAELLDDPAAYAAMARGTSPYGDGRAAPRIVDALLHREAMPVAA
jgi:UDP-N-acetylglucosamine 2-epimerase (non-hydrolysing)